VITRKRLFALTALAACALIGSATPSLAQGRRRVVVRGYYSAPFCWYDPWWGFGPPGPYLYPPYAYGYDAGAELRIEVEPKDAEVYLDGYYGGIVDDFDGVFQRLRTSPGEHDLTLFHDGYRTVTQHVYLSPGSTFKVKLAMERLAPGEPSPARPVPTAPPPGVRSGPPNPRRIPNGPPPFAPPANPPSNSPRAPSATTPPAPPGNGSGGQGANAPRASQGAGTLGIRVQPADAEIIVDGQPWRVPAGQDRVEIDTSDGLHTVQIRKLGYVGYLTEIEVRSGETANVDVTLRTQP
jgi:PEGA domain-containing protein